MKNTALRFSLRSLAASLVVAFAAQVAMSLTDERFGSSVQQVSPVFGAAIAIVLIGGYRYLPAIFLGALLPYTFTEAKYFLVLSVPFAATTSAAITYKALSFFRVECSMERIRDTMLIVIFGMVLAPAWGALVESFFICIADTRMLWSQFDSLFLINWLSASVGAIIVVPFLLTWTHSEGFRLDTRHGVEIALWFVALSLFGHVTFQNWAPTDTLLYPMELAIFPIMAWASIRFGLRGASAGVLVLAILAAWEIFSIQVGGSSMSQSPANVWVFVGILSLTSICLAAVMTELRIRETQITENESRLRAFTDALPDIGFVLTEQGEICDIFAASPSIEANHRIASSERAVGRHLSDLFDPEICDGFMETIASVVAGQKVQKHEYRLLSADVGEHCFEARVSLMSNKSPEAEARVVWVAYDVSERERSIADIRERDKFLLATARANNSLLTTREFKKAIESAMREVGQALHVDRAFVFEISNRTNEAFHAFHIRHEWRMHDSLPSILKNESFQEAPMEECLPGWYEILAKGKYINLDDVQAQRQDLREHLGSRSLLVMPMWAEGTLYGFFGVDQCESSRVWKDAEVNAIRVLASSLSGLILMRSQEEALRVAKEQADAASLAKGEFLAMMSHEIRTPMNAIIGYTDLLSRTELNETQHEHTSIIKRSGRVLLDLINNILDYSKIESRSLELEVRDFDLEQVLCEALESVLSNAKSKGLRVDYEVAGDVAENYLGDPHRIRQILMNLSSNAVKFTNKGSVTLRVSRTENEESVVYDHLLFEVQDTGCGIEPESLNKLFQAFSQVDSSTTRKFGGTGLGLVISKRLVERMEGEIGVKSQPGQGSLFYFSIPLLRTDYEDYNRITTEGADSQDDSLEASFAEAYPLKLLLCEDDKDNRWVIRELLEMLGYRPHVVESAEDALVQMQNSVYDAVLMDVRLPGRSGIELTKAIRDGSEPVEAKALYIIAVTAYAMNEDREKCLAAGMNDYIRKPVEIAGLKEALKRAAEQSPNYTDRLSS